MDPRDRPSHHYNRKSRYDGTSVGELKRLKVLEAGTAKLRRMCAALALETAAVRDVLGFDYVGRRGGAPKFDI